MQQPEKRSHVFRIFKKLRNVKKRMHTFRDQTDRAKSDRTNEQLRLRLAMARVTLGELGTKLPNSTFIVL